jgi:CHAT domain-containing protein
VGGGDEKDARPLEAGKPIKSELAVGQRHVYRIEMKADQFLKVVVEQNGIDVVAEVSESDGKTILEFDSESRTQGQEEVSFVAEVAGAFLLTILPKQNGAPAGSAGSYEIQVEELRVATDADRALHDARRQIEESLNLRHLGKYNEALPFVERALEIRERLLGNEHRDVADAIDILAIIYSRRGEYVKTEPLCLRALAIREKALGKDHPLTSLNNLAVLYTAKGDLVQAVKFQSRANTASERNLTRNFVIGSERQRMAYLATLSEQTDQTISFHLRYAPNDPMARNLAATLILQRKGRALDATSQNLNALRSRFNAEDQGLLDRLNETRSLIARLALGRPQKMNAEQDRDRIKALEDKADKNEADINRRSDEFRAQFLPVTVETVRAAIPLDSALIEFASYRPFNAKATTRDEVFRKPHYVAYILRRGGEVKWRELGEASGIDSTIAALRKALRAPRRGDVKRLARAVDEKVFQPLHPLLGNVSRLLISPDGSLNLIPFVALVNGRGRYAVERYSISYLASGRGLLRLQGARISRGGPLVVAAPDFGRGGQVEEAGLKKQQKDTSEGEIKAESARSAVRDLYFPPLPDAAQEGEALRVLLPGATLLTKRRATKAALSQMRSPRLLHIATHGFFLEDINLTSAGEPGAETLTDDPDRALQRLERRGVSIESPLLRSGLALAGANEQKEDDNGILTALEVTTSICGGRNW